MSAATVQSMDEKIDSPATILVVDDFESICTFVCDFLESLGYRTLSAPGGRMALRLSRSFKGNIDLLITDVEMDDLNGLDLARSLRQQRPQVHLLFMSAAGSDVAAEIIREFGTENFLEKPFQVEELRRRVREALA